jgi:hypothetical protein
MRFNAFMLVFCNPFQYPSTFVSKETRVSACTRFYNANRA